MPGTERLVSVVQEMSLARDLPSVMAIVRSAARELAQADGATFVLRDGNLCHYADEDAISPLWKGQRFPMEQCISGWAMLHRQSVAIEDIYQDPRIPHDAYRPTFVKSLVMVPIRTMDPVGAIGTYWAHRHWASPEERKLLHALADSASIAMENVRLYETLEHRVQERTAELEASRADLAAKNDALTCVQRQKEELAALLVHDLKSPAAGIVMLSRVRLRDSDLGDTDRRAWTQVLANAEIINRMALNLLDVTRGEDGTFAPQPEAVGLRPLVHEVVELMAPLADDQEQTLSTVVDARAERIHVDAELFRRVLQNVLENAVRHTPPRGTVTLRAQDVGAALEIRVADEGPGVPLEMRAAIFDKYARIEGAGQRCAPAGRGLGLTFCRLAVEAHGGTIHVEDNVPTGAVFVIRVPHRTGSSPVFAS